MSHALEDYALIGDGETAALIARTGSIDWLCWPRFDSDACFAALLGNSSHGGWLLAPTEPIVRTDRRYQQDTLIVETDFETERGAVRLIDFMPPRRTSSSVVRIVEGLRGHVAMRSDVRLRFDYGSLSPWCERTEEGATLRVGPDVVVLRAPVPITLDEDCQRAAFTVAGGERLAFVLSYGPSSEPPPSKVDAEQALTATQGYWREWIGRFDDAKTEWPEAVRRSLLTLRAMIYQPSGGMIAAPTTALPEAPGGKMNWDYRYCWLRDATFTVGALLNAGFHAEAQTWRDWLLRAVAGTPARMRTIYRVDGSRHLPEWTAETLPGYRYSAPVRIGNAASTQRQIDVYGEVLDCLHLARKGGVAVTAQEEATQLKILDELERVWDAPGAGVWESRSQPRQYTYSKTMAWVGVDRVLRFLKANPSEAGARLDHLEGLRSTIHAQVCREGWNPGLGTFTQYYGGHEIDASLLLMPLVGFLPPHDPRMRGTVECVRRELTDRGLVRRKKARTRKPAEGSFIACSCWMADCLLQQGRHAEAKEQFERVLALRNDVGLLSEEYDVSGKCLTGNFPQTLTHLAVINTALSLSGPTLTRGGP